VVADRPCTGPGYLGVMELDPQARPPHDLDAKRRRAGCVSRYCRRRYRHPALAAGRRPVARPGGPCNRLMFDWLLVGGGLHGCHTALRLTAARPHMQLAVIDP